MLREWIKALWRFFVKANNVMAKNINGKSFSRKNQICTIILFWGITGIVVWKLPKGISSEFIDYIKDIFAIFVGFFVTVLCFVFDKLDTSPVVSDEDENKMEAKDRGNSKRNTKILQEHNYTVRFFYTIGLIILYSATVIFLLIPNIFWNDWFGINIRDYCFVNSISLVTYANIRLFLHLAICIIYRLIVVYLTIMVFYYTCYSVSSLLQVLISKKNLKTWS